jgi:hypothetical protein
MLMLRVSRLEQPWDAGLASRGDLAGGNVARIHQPNQMKRFLLAFLMVISVKCKLEAQGTAFAYQGRLNDGSSSATGSYDLTFALFDSATDTTQVARL